MDPNANLTEQLELASTILNTQHDREEIPADEACRLAELVLSLNEWIRNGGFLPETWTHGG